MESNGNEDYMDDGTGVPYNCIGSRGKQDKGVFVHGHGGTGCMEPRGPGPWTPTVPGSRALGAIWAPSVNFASVKLPSVAGGSEFCS